jgi:hypothetical protein
MKKQTQKKSTLTTSRQWVVVTCLMVVLFLFAFAVYAADMSWTAGKQKADSSDVSVSGQTVCLPHKSTDGPQTEECAIGIKANNGDYYGVQNLDMSMTGMNASVKVHGTLTSAPESKYNIVGMIWVER